MYATAKSFHIWFVTIGVCIQIRQWSHEPFHPMVWNPPFLNSHSLFTLPPWWLVGFYIFFLFLSFFSLFLFSVFLSLFHLYNNVVMNGKIALLLLGVVVTVVLGCMLHTTLCSISLLLLIPCILLFCSLLFHCFFFCFFFLVDFNNKILFLSITGDTVITDLYAVAQGNENSSPPSGWSNIPHCKGYS